MSQTSRRNWNLPEIVRRISILMYLALAREAARMLKAIYYDPADTKFKNDLIEDKDLMPRFP